MGLGDKIRNAKDKAVGVVKKKSGKASDNPDRQAQGQGQNASGHVKQAGEEVKDAAKDAPEDLK
jgi:uncharacterized protein YjbJ (UPF0337 family)